MKFFFLTFLGVFFFSICFFQEIQSQEKQKQEVKDSSTEIFAVIVLTKIFNQFILQFAIWITYFKMRS